MDNKLIPGNAITLIDMLNKENCKAYLVGGCVRDMLLGVQPHDFDICTSALPSDTIDILKRHNIDFHTVGEKFGTITAMFGEEEYEITTFRADGEYSDGRHPDSVDYTDDIMEDLHRRDFTINAMAYHPSTKTFIDPYGGRQDLKSKTLRTVQNPDKSFGDDGLRMLRALRFAIRFEMKIEAATGLAIHNNLSLLDNISKERITQEFEKLFSYNKPIKPLFLEFSDLIGYIIPEIKPCIGFDQNNQYHKHDVYEHLLSVVDLCDTGDFCIKMAAMLHDIGKPNTYTVDAQGRGHFYGHPVESRDIAMRLLTVDFKLTNNQYFTICSLIEYHDVTVANTRASVKRMINKFNSWFHNIDMSVDVFNKWFILKQADIDDHINLNLTSGAITNIPRVKEILQQIVEENTCLKPSDLDISGYDIMQITGTKPGKHIGLIIQQLFELVLDEKLPNNNEDLKATVPSIWESINN